MAKRRFKLSVEQNQELQRIYRGCRDGATRTRYQAIRLYGEGYAVEEICHIASCNRSSLMEWTDKYRVGGLSALADHRGGRARAKLSLDQLAEIGQKVRIYRPRDVLGSHTQTISGQHWTVEDLPRCLERCYNTH